MSDKNTLACIHINKACKIDDRPTHMHVHTIVEAHLGEETEQIRLMRSVPTPHNKDKDICADFWSRLGY